MAWRPRLSERANVAAFSVHLLCCLCMRCESERLRANVAAFSVQLPCLPCAAAFHSIHGSGAHA